MEHFEITKTANGFHIEGFPDAVKVLRIAGKKSPTFSRPGTAQSRSRFHPGMPRDDKHHAGRGPYPPSRLVAFGYRSLQKVLRSEQITFQPRSEDRLQSSSRSI